MNDYSSLLLDVADGVATITMNRPERLNALNDALSLELVDAFTSLGHNGAVRVVVLTGAGRGFCSGADLGGGDAAPGGTTTAFAGRAHLKDVLQRIPLAIRALEKPVIAAVNGVAAGGGLDIAAACDIRVASDAARFTEIFARRGLFPGTGGCYLLPRIVGTARAAEMIFLGGEIDAQEALRIGLVSYVYPHAEFLSAAHAYALRFARTAPIATALAKASIYRSEHMEFPAALDYFATAESITLTSEDRLEGARAFRERREPLFTGR
ncbi:hypothetical protein AYO38_03400 [bacterium SCGC AG-212-C10]|nr:hypothetical protein AYO38_03400 [bacterium SCGC AG-212-C10]